MKRVYLDYAATTPTDSRVVTAMKPYFSDIFGNASSLHWFGQQARQVIENARQQVARLINSEPEELVFTSGGTEADNLALKGAVGTLDGKKVHIITTKIEHHAIISPLEFLEKQGIEVTYLTPNKDGLVSPDQIKQAMKDNTVLVSIMHANNEIGTIEPIKEIAQIIKDCRGIKKFPLFHTDAVQTVGHLPADVKEMNIDLLSLSAHKFYGPKGVGALFIRKGISLEPLLHGGEQERGRRASTENLPGIVGLGKAAELAQQDLETEIVRLSKLRDYFIDQVQQKIKNVCLNGHPQKRLPNNVNLSFEGIEGEGMMLSLDLVGVACSTGSACSSNTLEPSHVLLAIGASPEKAHSSLRFSLGQQTTKKDIDYTVNQLVKIVERLRKISPLISR